MLRILHQKLLHSFWFRQLEHGAALSLYKLMFPLRALRKGGILLFAYTGALGVATYLGLSKLERVLYEAVSYLAGQAQIDSTAVAFLLLTISGALWILALPLLLTAVALPIRILWVHGTLKNTQLLTDTLPSMKASIRTIALMIKLELRYFIPLLLMICLYVPFIRSASHTAVAQVFSLALATVIFVTFYRALPGLLSPLLAILGRFRGREAVIYSESILREKRSELLLVSISSVAVLLFLYRAWHGRTLAQPAAFSGLEVGAYVFVMWYALVLLSASILEALKNFSAFSRE